jgi:hypothetical protein
VPLFEVRGDAIIMSAVGLETLLVGLPQTVHINQKNKVFVEFGPDELGIGSIVFTMASERMADEITRLTTFIRHNPSIMAISLFHATFDAQEWERLIRTVRDMPGIVTLSIKSGPSYESTYSHVCDLLANLIRTHTGLRALTLDWIRNDDAGSQIVDAIAGSQIDELDIKINTHQFESVGRLIAQNRTVQSLAVRLQPHSIDSVCFPAAIIRRWTELAKDNWALRHFLYVDQCHYTAIPPSPLNLWRMELKKLVTVLLPLRLTPYVVLWITDWLPPMSARYAWRGDPAHDPYHGAKIALIERFTRAYRKLVAAEYRSATED